MLTALKIWWLKRRLNHLIAELAMARADKLRQIEILDMEINYLQHCKQRVILRLLDLEQQQEAGRTDATHEHA